MKKLLIKLIIFTMILFIFTGCYTLSKIYSYNGGPVDNPKNYYEYRDYIYVYTFVMKQSDENSPVKIIKLVPENKKIKFKNINILNDKIKIIYNKKIYYADVSRDRTAIFLSDLNIMGDFIIEIGEVKTDNKKIIKIPPLKLKQYVKVTKYNPIADGLNIDTSQDIYYGPAEGYKGR